MEVLVYGILGGLCLAGSVVGVRSEVGFASAGGTGRVKRAAVFGAVGRSVCAAVR